MSECMRCGIAIHEGISICLACHGNKVLRAADLRTLKPGSNDLEVLFTDILATQNRGETWTTCSWLKPQHIKALKKLGYKVTPDYEHKEICRIDWGEE